MFYIIFMTGKIFEFHVSVLSICCPQYAFFAKLKIGLQLDDFNKQRQFFYALEIKKFKRGLSIDQMYLCSRVKRVESLRVFLSEFMS